MDICYGFDIRKSKESTSNIIARAISHASFTAGVLSSHYNIRWMIARIHRENDDVPNDPKKINDFLVPAEYCKAWSGVNSSMSDSNNFQVPTK